MAEQDQAKPKQQQKQQQKQAPQQKQQKHSLLDKKEVPTYQFERPDCHGWHTVVFPFVHDENTVLELWLADAYEWLKLRGFKEYFWTYAHGVEKKEQNRISPMFFYRDEMQAAAMMWRFNGELVRKDS